MDRELSLISQSHLCSLYQVSAFDPDLPLDTFIASTPGTRRICNDPLFVGVDYTRTLSASSAAVITALQSAGLLRMREEDCCVLHILRGGLNFGLREALHDALGWNVHGSAFVSAQRARDVKDPRSWIITESGYKKFRLRPAAQVICGDVVATGTSLEYGLQRLTAAAREQGAAIESLLFVTIGGPRTERILTALARRARELFPAFTRVSVVYLEGIFSMATSDSPLRIKIDGTDLLRRDALLAPEFVSSQYESPSYPLERCTIYDAGSRAFDIEEYLHDVKGYWEATLKLAQHGTTFGELIKERCPELREGRFGKVDLAQVAKEQLSRITKGA